MMKHNNEIAHEHFHKDWQRRVKTWFDQPANKLRRRNTRAAKAKRLAPRPLNRLRPVVRCQTIKYNMKVRAGRGFTLEEVRGAGFKVKEAQGLGIAIDHRRKNRSEESFRENVQRLKSYKARLVIFPRKASNKRVKKGDSSKAEQAKATQVLGEVFPIEQPSIRQKPRKITKEEVAFKAQATVRKIRTDSKLWGMRERRAKEKAEKEAQAALKKGKNKGGEEGGDE